MLTISRLARQFNLSRSTLLYYDRIGLLRPSSRTASNYRLYSRFDRQRLERICRYRSMGLSIDAIRTIIDAPHDGLESALKERLAGIERQMRVLRKQQGVIRNLLKIQITEDMWEGLTREKWTTLLRATGMSEADMVQWHIEFERLFPDDHQAFLESLDIPEGDIDAIRAMSRQEKR